MTFGGLFGLLRDSVTAFSTDRAPRLAAALAYYAVFTIAPLLFLLVAVASIFINQDTVKRQIYDALSSSVGASAANFVSNLVDGAVQSGASTTATIIGAVTVFLTSTGLFAQLQDALNSLWGADPPPINGLWALVRTRLIGFALVLFFGALIIAFLAGSTLLSAYAAPLANQLGLGAFFTRLGTFVLGTAVFTVVFASIYKFLPYVQLKWREVWFGAGVTATLFTLGQLLISFYLGRFSNTSVFGAAGSLVVLLLWIYYSGMILFFGAEVTWVYSQRYGSRAGGASNPGKKVAVAQQGVAVNQAPSAQEREAARHTPGEPVSPVANPHSGRSEVAARRAGSPPQFQPPQSQPPGPPPLVGRALAQALFALLALPTLPVLWLIRRLGKR